MICKVKHYNTYFSKKWVPAADGVLYYYLMIRPYGHESADLETRCLTVQKSKTSEKPTFQKILKPTQEKNFNFRGSDGEKDDDTQNRDWDRKSNRSSSLACVLLKVFLWNSCRFIAIFELRKQRQIMNNCRPKMK